MKTVSSSVGVISSQKSLCLITSQGSRVNEHKRTIKFDEQYSFKSRTRNSTQEKGYKLSYNNLAIIFKITNELRTPRAATDPLERDKAFINGPSQSTLAIRERYLIFKDC